MRRRGILGWLGAGAAASVAPVESLTSRSIQAMDLSSIGCGSNDTAAIGRKASVLAWGEADAKALRSLRRRMERVEREGSRRSYMRERTLLLCGGHAPHVATCGSWAPWFKARATIRWQMEQEAAQMAEERARSQSIAAGFSRLIQEALPDWMRGKLEDDE